MIVLGTLIAALAMQPLAVGAVPLAAADGHSTKASTKILADASVYMCEHTRWNGACLNVLVPLNSCQNVPGGWNDRISSIRNDSRNYYHCVWYTDGNCGGTAYDNQEDADLSDGNGRMNDSISSWSCRNRHTQPPVIQAPNDLKALGDFMRENTCGAHGAETYSTPGEEFFMACWKQLMPGGLIVDAGFGNKH
ncbi:hypothetical protein HJFPF1_13154 [Paramyrothecium foliicola]|nr:hypothetical protein HJFPF1_13154 [Paramyrothecium foliicola]